MKYNLKFKKKIVSVTKIKVIEYSNGTIIYKDNHIKKVWTKYIENLFEELEPTGQEIEHEDEV